MARPLFCYPNHVDGSTMSGGSYVSTLPLDNVKDRRPRKVARTTDDANASTQGVSDFGSLKRVRAVSLHGHNLSLAARRRFRVYPTSSVTRNDAGTYIDEDGVVQSVGSNVLRNWHYVTDETDAERRATLLERAYTNLVTSDDLTAWTTSGTPVVTGSISDPAGGTAAYTVADDDGASLEYITRAISFTGNGVKAVTFIVHERTMPASGNQQLVLIDTTAAANRLVLNITGWVAGKPTITAATGTLLALVPVGDYWLVQGQTTTVTAANSNSVRVIPAATAAQTGSIDVYRIAAYNNAVPPPSVLSASEVTTQDSFSVDMIDSTPQAATYLFESVVLDLPNTGSAKVLMSIGASGDNRIYLIWAASANQLQVQYRNSTTSVTGSWNYTPSLYDHIVVRVRQESTGAITAGLTVNGAAEAALDSPVSTQALPTAWGNPRVRFGTATSGLGSPCNVGLIQARGQSGAERTVAQMQALEDPDIFDWTVYDSQWQAAYPAIYPAGATILGEDVGGGAVTADQWADGKDVAIIDVLTRHQPARYFAWEIDDTANVDTYVDVGRAFAGPAWQPQTAGIQDGAEFAYFDPSTAEILAGSSAIIRERVPYKTWGFDLALIESDEARTQLMEFRRQIGKRGQFLFIFDPDDALNLSEFSFLARCDSGAPASISHEFLFDSAFSIVQEV